MNPNTGEIFFFENDQEKALYEANNEVRLVGLNKELLNRFVNLALEDRVKEIDKTPCACLSGLKFAECCKGK